ncbi:non-ribosomal peptide synthetase [Sessilibacter corallicola]|uniref:Carrier domain-containing protein n=1 Tax=Sessilibacter corallicola TaxID=2904075 RepID=A0ABQ0ADT6_9GAMM
MAGVMFDLSQDYFPHQIIERHANLTPSSMAIRFGSKEMSFAELNRNIKCLAAAFTSAVDNDQPKIAVLLDPNLLSPAVALAIFSIGGTYIPIDPEFPESRIQSVIRQSAPDVVITSSERMMLLPEGVKTLTLQNALETKVSDCNHLAVEIPLNNTAFIFFTSGTTGEPKGVKGSYSNLIYYTSSAIQRYSMTSKTVMPTIAKFTFSISLFELICPILAGGSVRVLPRAMVTNPDQMAEVMMDITMIHCGPALMRRIVDYLAQTFSPEQLASRYSHLFHASMGGDLVPVELLQRLLTMFRQSEIFVIYGCSEISCMGTTQQYFLEQLPDETLVGSPFDGVDVLVVNDNGEEVQAGEKGEVCFSGPGVTAGYLNRNELTAEKYRSLENKTFYNTGDIGVLNERGELKLLGRKDFQVKINGIRIELAEVDVHLRHAPYLDQVIAMAQSTDNGDKAIYAYVTQDLTVAQISEIRAYLKASVQEVMHPRAFVRIDALPTNHNLKIDRNALPLPNAENLIAESDAAPPETPVQRRLLSIWKSVLGNETIGIDDDFFDFGGTSLSSIDIARKIDEQMGISVPLNELLLASTVRLLSEKLDDIKRGHKTSGMILLRRGSEQEQVVFLHDGNGDVIPYYTLAQQLIPQANVFGLAPKSFGRIETVHTSIAQMVDYYCDQISQLNLASGVHIGGLCIGGFVAFCVAAELERRGVEVKTLFLFDSHYIDAVPCQAEEKLSDSANRLTQVMTQLDTKNQIDFFLKKLISYSKYRISVISKCIYRPLTFLSLFVATKFKLLSIWLFPTPDVDTVLRRCEKKFRNGAFRPQFDSKVVFFKALEAQDDLEGKAGLEIDDTPYMNYFEGDYLGWDKIIPKDNLEKVEVGAGHSTMLIGRYVGVIANVINTKLKQSVR